MSEKIKISSCNDIKPDQTKKFIINDTPILVINLNQSFYAIHDLCTHEDSSLSLGCLKGEYVDCTLHGSRFNVITGIPIDEPATEAVQTYPVSVIDNVIYIEI